jgi:ketosteroid isomerase-like protein
VVSSYENARLMLEIFSAIERRDASRVATLFDADLELHWPASLPYGGVARGVRRTGPSWEGTWDPLQPSEAERRMDPRVVAASPEEVVVLWRQRGVSPAGERFDGEVLGLYQMRKGKLVRGQMFYFDTAALARFLARATGRDPNGS